MKLCRERKCTRSDAWPHNDMNEVTITAENRLEAILKVRSEVGTNAVILSEHRIPAPGIPGRLGKKMYEVVAAAQLEVPAPEQPVEPPLNPEALRKELDELRAMMTDLQEHAIATVPTPSRTRRAWHDLGLDPEDLGPVADRLPTPNVLRSLLPTADIPVTARTIVYLGPVGVDTRSAALQIAAELGGVLLAGPPHEWRSNDAEPTVISAGQLPTGTQFEEMRLRIEELGAKVHLVMSAAAKPRDVLHFLESLAGLAPERIVWIGLETTCDLSGMLVAGARWGIPISHIADSLDVRPASPEELLSRM